MELRWFGFANEFVSIEAHVHQHGALVRPLQQPDGHRQVRSTACVSVGDKLPRRVAEKHRVANGVDFVSWLLRRGHGGFGGTACHQDYSEQTADDGSLTYRPLSQLSLLCRSRGIRPRHTVDLRARYPEDWA